MDKNLTFRERLTQLAPIIGSVLVLSGILLLIDQRIKTNWLSISIPIAIGLLVLIWGILRKLLGGLITGVLLLATGGAFFWSFQQMFPIEAHYRNALIFASIGLSLVFLFLILLLFGYKCWWLLFPSFILFGMSYQFGYNQLGLLDFVLIQCIALSLGFLLWGTFRKKIGLIIPGTLISSIGTGVYVAWNDLQRPEALQSTGIMLVWFSLGWILITLFNRVIHKRFTWWPLIPGGIFLMVGAGLYIGGNPENAVGFLGNTGSVALVLLGVYLILMKFGLNQRNH